MMRAPAMRNAADIACRSDTPHHASATSSRAVTRPIEMFSRHSPARHARLRRSLRGQEISRIAPDIQAFSSFAMRVNNARRAPFHTRLPRR